jgi:hypothetical protein
MPNERYGSEPASKVEGVPAARDLTDLLVAQQNLPPNGGRHRLRGAGRCGSLIVSRGPVGQVDLPSIAAGGLPGGGGYLDRIRTGGLDPAPPSRLE